MITTKPFRLTQQDFKHFCQYTCSGKLDNEPTSVFKRLRPFAYGALAGFAVATMVFMVLRVFDLRSDGFHWPTAVRLFLLFAIFLAVGYYQQHKIRRRLQPAEGGAVLRETTFTLSEEGVLVQSAFSTISEKWAGIRRVLENQGAIYLFIDQNVAYIATASAFESDQHRDEFLSYAKSMTAASSDKAS